MKHIFPSCLVLAAAAAFGCKVRDQASETKVAAAVAVADAAVVGEYRSTINRFLQNQSVAEGWDWFMRHSHGFEATPMVLVRMLPELDPGIWGKTDEKFARFGHYVLPGDEKRPLPSSLGMAQFPTKADPDPVIVTTETCGTCHMGRVRIPSASPAQGEILFLYGGVNVQFDIRKWRTATEQTVAKYMSTPEKVKQTVQRLRTLVAAEPIGFFHEDVAQDAWQRHFIMEPGGAEKIVAAFVKQVAVFTEAKRKQRTSTYKNSNSPEVDAGHPGQVDASGDLLAQGLPLTVGMPAHASLTDIPSVWKQSEYSVGQWDGSVTSQFIRNLAAQIAVVPGRTVDRRVAHFALQFVTDLPPPKFPFVVASPRKQEALVAMGQALFTANCADCHKPLNNQIYANLGTDMSRADVMTRTGTVLVAKAFYDACNAKLPDGTSPPDCGNFLKSVGGGDAKAGPGYAGKPLTGLWARAPYLHNGSVPTLRHLLLPSTRPQRFVVGSLGYDATNVGFLWDLGQIEAYRQWDPQVNVFDAAQDGLSNKGHDQASLKMDGKEYRLDWTPQPGDDPDAVEALLAYLRTL